MKKIAIFSGYYLPHLGGVERYTFNLAKKMKELGNEVVIVTLRYDQSLTEIEENNYAKIYRLPTFKIFASRYPIVKKNKRCKELLKLISRENIDSVILQTRFWTSSYIGSKFAKQNNIPMCVIEHGSSHFTVHNKFLDFFGRIYEHILTNLIKKNVKDFYGVSKKCNEWLKHFKIYAKGVFYNSIDTDEFNKYGEYIKKNDKIIKITYAGRLLKEKGVLILLDCFNELSKEVSNVELNIAGTGPLYSKLKEEANKNPKIKILGNLSHDKVMKLLARTDIFINLSFSEGLPTSILEAGLMKCTVIATPVGGTTEIIKNKDSGVLCSFEVSQINDELKKIINDEEKRNKFGSNIHSIIENEFSWDITTKKTINTISFK